MKYYLCVAWLTLMLVTGFSMAENTIIVGIAGGTGSGKSTFAKKIKEIFEDDAVLIEQDAYYKDLSHLSMEERQETNFDHPESLDFAQLRQDLIDLKNGIEIYKPTYDFITHSRTMDKQKVSPAKIILVEGVLLLAVAEIRDICDIKLYIDVEDDIRLLRRLERDLVERGRSLESIKKQYMATVRPMHYVFVAPSKAYADVIIPSIGDTTEAEKMIISRLRQQ